jgi:hypothetical protein
MVANLFYGPVAGVDVATGAQLGMVASVPPDRHAQLVPSRK